MALKSNNVQEIHFHIRIAEKNVIMLRYKVADILDYSHYLRHDHIRLQKSSFQVKNVMEDLNNIFIEQAEIKSVAMHFVYHPASCANK